MAASASRSTMRPDNNNNRKLRSGIRGQPSPSQPPKFCSIGLYVSKLLSMPSIWKHAIFLIMIAMMIYTTSLYKVTSVKKQISSSSSSSSSQSSSGSSTTSSSLLKPNILKDNSKSKDSGTKVITDSSSTTFIGSSSLSKSTGGVSNVNDGNIIKPSNQGSTAIIHVGPQKTGSTSIQRILGLFREQGILQKDNYLYGNFAIRTDAENFIDNARRFSDCFVVDTKVYKHDPNNYCNDTIVQYVKDISNKHHSSMILSSEWLSGDAIELEKFYMFLSSNWEQLYVVMYYRRFFDWLISYHYQGEKNRPIKRRRTILDITKYALQKDSYFDKQYVVDLLLRYRVYFPNVKVINMHENNNDVREAFFCGDTIPNSPNICESFREIVKKEAADMAGGSLTENVGKPLVYEEIAYYAKQINLINYIEEEFDENGFKIASSSNNNSDTSNLMTLSKLADKVADYHEVTLGKNLYDFPKRSMNCMNDNEYNILYEKGKAYEMMLFPDKSLVELDKLYNVSRVKFCHIDAKIVLTDDYELWKTFFESLSGSGTGPTTT